MKPSIPQGTRDFGPEVVGRRQYILQTIASVFKLYGYQPIETPAMENLSTLMGKYGDEGDRLIFKILNNGLDNPEKESKTRNAMEEILKGKNSEAITERALRYDLTIPFARYVVMNQGTMVFPFKRYQMQPVWRADRPQRGRYREFWQCDADVVGSNSLFNEAELLNIYTQSFEKLGIPNISININNRKILAALAEELNKTDSLNQLTVAIDKLDKIGKEKVFEELLAKGFEEKDILIIDKFLSIEGDNEAKLKAMESLLGNQSLAMTGINELKETLQYYAQLNPESDLVHIDFKLARGLDYYTGLIVEVTTTAVKMGSIGGGGRYDDLTSLFGLKYMSGVGISFGVDRIYDVMEELDLFKEQNSNQTQLLLLAFEQEAEPIVIQYLSQARNAGIPSEYFVERGKYDKQLKYANRKNVPFVGIVGSAEMEGNFITFKDMKTGIQKPLKIDELIEEILKSE